MNIAPMISIRRQRSRVPSGRDINVKTLNLGLINSVSSQKSTCLRNGECHAKYCRATNPSQIKQTIFCAFCFALGSPTSGNRYRDLCIARKNAPNRVRFFFDLVPNCSVVTLKTEAIDPS